MGSLAQCFPRTGEHEGRGPVRAPSHAGSLSPGLQAAAPIALRIEAMELRSIQYFLQIAGEGSITRTAQKIGVAQPALTRHVQQLEAELGSQLLLRLPRGERLTTAGRDFLEHARRIVL